MGVDGIKALFDKARGYAPSIVFIDEIDAIPKRGTAGLGADMIVNRLLTEIDGFHGVADEPVFIVAATNLPDKLDDALIRSGRIEYHIEVPFLDRDARGFFIDKILSHKAFKSEDMNRADLIQLSSGMNGSQLEQVKRECILTMIRDECIQVTNENLIEQMNFVKYGHKLELDESVLRMEETAVHEAGHLVAQWYLAPATKIEQITVMARADFLGMVSYEHGDNPEYSRVWLMGQTCVALAGREAQIMKHGERSLDAGASSDLNAVMHYANLAIVKWGMDDDLYNVSVSGLKAVTGVIRNGVEIHEGVNYFNTEVESAVKSWVSEATDKTRSLLTEHWDEIEKITEAVLEKEVLYNEEISDILGERPKN
jgi:ATP-dependent Zn protease